MRLEIGVRSESDSQNTMHKQSKYAENDDAFSSVTAG